MIPKVKNGDAHFFGSSPLHLSLRKVFRHYVLQQVFAISELKDRTGSKA
jgi:hypothetical protein